MGHDRGHSQVLCSSPPVAGQHIPAAWCSTRLSPSEARGGDNRYLIPWFGGGMAKEVSPGGLVPSVERAVPQCPRTPDQTCARPHKQPRRDLVTGVPEGSPETMDMGSSSVGLLEGNAPPRQTISVGDYLSRQRLPPGEWRLHPQVVQMIWDRYGRPR